MPSRRGWILCTVLTTLVLGQGRPASGEWIVDSRGECVERWTPASLGRGPTAMLMAPTAPVRTGAGVFAYQSPAEQGWNGQGSFIFWGPAVALLSGAAGVIDMVWWLGSGLVDTLSGGYFQAAPYEATRLSVDPLPPPFLSEGKRRALEAARPDPCGRLRKAS
jgi:hypothetical protein